MKNLPNRAIFFLTNLFNNCLLLCYFPDAWKLAMVFPLLKPGKPPVDLFSYRPISLQSVPGKFFERLILTRIQFHIDEKNIFPNHQFGFRSLHSTGLQILRIFKYVIKKKQKPAKVFDLMANNHVVFFVISV